jgi:hypothetical protein
MISPHPPTFFKKATAADALIDPQNPNHCQISLTTDSEDVHIFQVTREVLMQLARRIEQVSSDVPIHIQK